MMLTKNLRLTTAGYACGRIGLQHRHRRRPLLDLFRQAFPARLGGLLTILAVAFYILLVGAGPSVDGKKMWLQVEKCSNSARPRRNKVQISLVIC